MIWAPLCLLPGSLAGCSWFLPGGRFPFCWLLSGAPGFQSFFSFSSAQISLSLSALLAPASCPWGYSWLVPVSVLAIFVAWVDPRHLLVAYLLVSLRFCTVIFRSLFSHLPGGVQLFCFPLAPFQSVLLVCPGRWLIFMALSSAFCQVIDCRLLSSLWFGWCSATFPAALHPASLFGLLAVPPFLLSGLVAVCFPGLWVSLFPCRLPRPGLLFPGSRHLQLPPLRGTRGGVWILPFCSSGVFHTTLSHGLSLVSVYWDGFSGRSIGSEVFSLNFLTLVSVGVSPV